MKNRSAPLLVAMLCLLAACSSPPTSSEQSTDTGGSEGAASESGSAAETSATAESTLAELDGVDADARREQLIGLAEEEGGAVTLYTSLNAEVLDVLADAFEEDTGVEIEQYRASSEAVRDRLLQEAEAGFAGADVVETNGPEMQILADEGVLQPYSSPVTEQLADGSVNDPWVATRLNIFTTEWNTDLVPEGEQPTTYQDLADPKWDGRMVMEISDIDWYRAVHQYLTEDDGMSEEEVDQLFQDIADGSAFVSGHTTFRQLVAAGEYALAASDYSYGVQALVDEGAPVAWQPSIEPLFARPNGAAVVGGAPRPASALLLMDWLLSDGQDVLEELNITPTRMDLAGTGDTDVRVIDIGEYLEEEQEWTERYEQLQQAGEAIDG